MSDAPPPGPPPRGARGPRRRLALVVSCEHGGARVPAAYRWLFRGAQAVLNTHRGQDFGALELARDFARRLRALEAGRAATRRRSSAEPPLFCSTVTRLLVELNRSRRHPRLFSEFSRRLNVAQRRAVLTRYYEPYRAAVEQALRTRIRRAGRVLHLSVHTFTPVLAGSPRSADVGLLYDPARPPERAFCADWLVALRGALPDMRVRRNYPYRGVADGFTTHLRRVFEPGEYLGIELEVSQRIPAGPRREWSRIRGGLIRTFADAVSGSGAGAQP